MLIGAPRDGSRQGTAEPGRAEPAPTGSETSQPVTSVLPTALR